MEEKLISYTINTVLKLACDQNIDHRNYAKEKNESRLLKSWKEHKTIDEAVKKIINKLLEEEEFIKSLKNLKDDEDNEDDEEEEKREEICRIVFDYIGIGEINNLHGDDTDKFKDELMKCFDE